MTFVLIMMILMFVGSVIGAGTAALFETKDPKWGTYACFCMLVGGLILASGNAKYALLFLALLTLPLNVDFRLFVRERDLSGPQGVFLSPQDICALFLLLFLLIGALVRKREQIRWCPRMTVPWLLLLGAVVLSMPFSYDKTVTGYRALLLFQHILLYFAVANVLSTEAEVQWALKGLVGALVLGSALYCVSCVTGRDIDLVTGATRGLARIEEYGGVVRPAGTFGHPVQAGQYFVGAVWIPLALLYTARRASTRILLYAVFALGSVCMAYTLSRAAYVGYVPGLLCYVVCGYRAKIVQASTAMVSAVVVFVLLLFVGGLVWNRLTLDDQGSGESRKPLNKQAIYMASKNPILGVGAGTYEMAMDEYQPPGVHIGWRHYVHNEYLLWWAECGTPGLLALLLFLGSAVVLAWRTLGSSQPVSKAAGLTLLCMVAALLPNIWFDVGTIGMANPGARLVTVILGICAAAGAIADNTTTRAAALTKKRTALVQ